MLLHLFTVDAFSRVAARHFYGRNRPVQARKGPTFDAASHRVTQWGFHDDSRLGAPRIRRCPEVDELLFSVRQAGFGPASHYTIESESGVIYSVDLTRKVG
jgi:hypothetical protein